MHADTSVRKVETEMTRYLFESQLWKVSLENSKEKNLMNWKNGMFDLDGLRMGYLERFCFEHLRCPLAMGEVKIKYFSDLLCMGRVGGWWSKALEKVPSDQRNQSGGGTPC